MIGLLIMAQFMFGTVCFAPDPDTIAELEKRGLSTRLADFPAAIDEAFAQRDKELVLALAKDMMLTDHGERFADQIIGLYEELPEDDFKESIAVPLADGMQNVERVMVSRWACEFYGRAIKVLYSASKEKYRASAESFLEALSKRCGLSLTPYLVKAVLTNPALEAGSFLGRLVREQWSAVTPSMAFQIQQRYGKWVGPPSEDIDGPIKDRAKPLLNAKQLPPGSSREDVLKQLDAMIDAEGKKLCDKYENAAYVPLPPSPPRSPNAPVRYDP
jgi:hypothetical protein